MSSDALREAEDAEGKYRWTNKLMTNVYSGPVSDLDRDCVAHLFAGEWTRYIDEAGDELHIGFRGGEGYALKRDIGKERVLEIYFIDVGQGDSMLIETPDDKRVLIDGGKSGNAHSFLRWKYNLPKHYKAFDAVIATHGDADHAKGLIGVLNDEKIIVRSLYHNGIAEYTGRGLGSVSSDQDGKLLTELYSDVEELRPKYSELTPFYKSWVDAVTNARERAEKEGHEFSCRRADQNTGAILLGDPDGPRITFLGPVNLGDSTSPRLRVFKDEGMTINGNSVCVLLEYRKARILLCGDLNEPAEAQLQDRVSKEAIRANVYKASHHGSQHFTTTFLGDVKPWVTVVSSGTGSDYGHPRANLLGSLGHYAPKEIEKPLLFSTQLAATFKRIPKSKLGEKGVQVYEKTIHGMINVRTNGEWLAAGRVYARENVGGKAEAGASAGPPRKLWIWEAYAFGLATGKALSNNLLQS